ncbi:hypothetical protein DCAR_0625223 [Daucus carota subsp. sativus]|uniref:RRM domain-containing protein n=1 Tax=Daucus carota subsp. sativus TaxID=79200 RepID=A0AAF0XET9_DAUCS|nr:hypothetical protein DCAR_0625223 [Daucus carota subsp. sativus]
MQSDLGKLFIGGISWDTDEERLKEYFSSFGEVLEAVIMKDRTTGRARGFGFIVFADPAVADRVIKEKHNIDGRLVEAKKAVPKDDHSSAVSRNSGSIQGSPGPVRTRKIFVGGLASTVTESDFRSYFEQFGNITDVVVMYDHNTQRPRGFGFITYDSEDSVDNVLLRTFHELNGKMVEVKRAVPKELTPSPNRSPLGGFNYGLGRMSSVLNGYNQGYSPNALGGLGVRMDGRFSPITAGRTGFAPFGSGYGMNLNLGMNPNYGGNVNLNNSVSYGRGMGPFYNSNRVNNPTGFDGGNLGNTASLFNSQTRNLWGNGGLDYGANPTNTGGYVGSGTSSIGARNFGFNGLNWDNSPISPQAQGGRNVSSQGGIIGYGVENSYNLGGGAYGRNSATTGARMSSHSSSNGGYDATFGDIYGSHPVYGDSTWHAANSEKEDSVAFSYGLGDGGSDAQINSSPGYVEGYGVTRRQTNRGIKVYYYNCCLKGEYFSTFKHRGRGGKNHTIAHF